MSAPVAVTIAGSDSGGGAGLQADLKTFSALGVYGASVVTALTAQNTLGVQAIHEVPPEFVGRQMDSVFGDLAVRAVKIGMLATVPVIDAVADGLARHGTRGVVLDPVMVATSGDRLLAADAVDALRRRLFPLAAIVTPNLHEAAALLDCARADDEREMERQALALLAFGAAAVLVKGGHGGTGPGRESESVDVLATSQGVTWFAAARIRTGNTHGTGCTLSAAIAAGLARGMTLDEALDRAKTYVTQAIAAADRLQIGHGHGPTHHFHAWW